MRRFIAALVATVVVGGSSVHALAQTVSVSPTSVVLGRTVTATWSGFSGNVNVEVWRGGAKWVDSIVDVPGAGTPRSGVSARRAT